MADSAECKFPPKNRLFLIDFCTWLARYGKPLREIPLIEIVVVAFQLL